MRYCLDLDVIFLKRLTEKILSGVLSVIIAGSCAVAVSAAGVKCGDINGDTYVNSADALAALNHSVGADKLEGGAFTCGDVNADKKIDSSDALDILLYSVGKITSFKAEKAMPINMYADAIKKARNDRPFYRIRNSSKVGNYDVKVSDPLGLLGLAGTSAKEMEAQMKEEILNQQTNVEQTFCNKGSTNSFNNLPVLCTVTDPSKYKSLKLETTPDGKYKIEIKFNDEKNPTAQSTLCKVLGVAGYDEMTAMLEDSLEIEEGVSVNVKLNELSYKNSVISCILDPKTGELSELEWSTNMSMDYTVKMVVDIHITMETSVTTSYWDFAY